MADFGYEALNKMYEGNKTSFTNYNARRVERCLSWIAQAEKIDDNVDAGFLFLWIAFEALYGAKNSDDADWQLRKDFFNLISRQDRAQNTIYNTIMQESRNIENLISNVYAFQSFWKYRNREMEEASYERQFITRNEEVMEAIRNRDTISIMVELFNRLYVLRNQIMHGGATWGSYRNRDTVTYGWKILSILVPTIARIILNNPRINLGRTYYHADDQ